MERPDTGPMPSRVPRRPLVRFAAAAVAIGVVVAVLAVALAGADSGRYVAVQTSDNNLWATVNFCHGKRADPSFGVRARMPADNPAQRLYLRFQRQHRK